MRVAPVLALLALSACVRQKPSASTGCNEPPPVNGSAIAWERTFDSEGDGVAVEGLVTDVRGAPLKDAMVQLSGTRQGVLTGADGRFRLGRVPAREYIITVRVAGYTRTERSISLGDGEGARVLAILERAPSGMIYDCFD